MPVLLLPIWSSVPATVLLAMIAAAIAASELCRLSPGRLPPLLSGVAIVGAILLPLNAGAGWQALPALVTGITLVPPLMMVLLPARERSPQAWAWTVAGAFYVGWPLSLAVLVRGMEHGREWLVSGILLVFAIDAAAYFFGKAFGRRKLAPTISPGKTWEGSCAGLVTGIGVALASAPVFGLGVPSWKAAAFGLAVAVASQLGDLAESMIKRAAGAKDAGVIVPGHGGLLDRLDSLIPAFTVLYFFLLYLE